ncbi:hypothetical protein ACFY8C_31585 [Streptomyces flavochromogenes]|uniref:Uncharacterized protein n=1 Tax=Streptomyces flavochromogenes TaxID=68199 RepID=A0ABW6XZ97_9ACTN
MPASEMGRPRRGAAPHQEAFRLGLGAWLVRHAPTRLDPQGTHEDLLHRIRLIGPSRRGGPHWPDYRH